jgi:hypothetical protein
MPNRERQSSNLCYTRRLLEFSCLPQHCTNCLFVGGFLELQTSTLQSQWRNLGWKWTGCLSSWESISPCFSQGEWPPVQRLVSPSTSFQSLSLRHANTCRKCWWPIYRVLKVHGNTMSEMSPQEFQFKQNVNPITPNFAVIKFSSSDDHYESHFFCAAMVRTAKP